MNAQPSFTRHVLLLVSTTIALTAYSSFGADTTPPTVTCSATTSTLWPANHSLVDIGLRMTVSDNLDPAPRIAVSVFSNESNNEAGSGNLSPDGRITSTQVLLRAERSGSGNGRVYVVIVKATDSSGNISTGFCTVVVAHDQSNASINRVRQMAAQISAQTLPPAGYLLIANGPDTASLQVTLTSPPDNANFLVGDSITITASTNFSATKVEYYNALTKIGESSSSPFLFNWNGSSMGSYTLSAVATDSSGNRVSSRPATVVINQPTPTPTPPPPTPTIPPPTPTPSPTATPFVDTDGDGVPDDEDIYPDDPHLDLRRVPDTQYAIIQLDSEGPGFGEVVKLNNLNHVIRNTGWNGQLTFYKDGNKILISGLPGNDVIGNPFVITALGGINDQDNIVGQANYPFQQIPGIRNDTTPFSYGNGFHAFRSVNGGPIIDLGDLTGDLTYTGDGGPVSVVGANNAYSIAFGINNANVVVGQSDTQLRVDPPETDEIGILRSSGRHASVLEPSRKDLGALPGNDTSSALAINNFGDVVGWGVTSNIPGSYLNFPHRAVLWSNNTMQNLGALDPRNTTQAVDVNDAGYVLVQESKVGFFQSNFNMDVGSGFLWHDGHVVRIVSQARYGLPNAVNAKGQVVGTNWNAPYGGFIFQNDQTIRLDDRIDLKSGWRISTAHDINDGGVIVGNAYRPDTFDSALVLLAPAELMVDASRDGELSFTDKFIHDDDLTYEDAPYRFWLNDDDDGSGNAGEQVPAINPDYADGVIRSKRDLEDFARLHVYLGAFHEEIESGAIQLAFEWRDTEGTPKIKLYKGLSEGTEYLTSDTQANLSLLPGNKDTLGEVTATTPLIMPADFWTTNPFAFPKTLPTAWFLFEGSGEGKGRLVIAFYRDDQFIGESPGVWLELKNIKKMYQRGKAVMPDQSDNVPAPYTFVNTDPPNPGIIYVADDNGHAFEESHDENRQTIVFVHGWRMTYGEALNFGETLYKRLWHRGFKGRFATFRWPTFTGLPPVARYNESEYRAWACGDALNQFVASMPYQNAINVCAHSMGNIVVGSALIRGMHATNYVLMQAAIASGCYDINQPNYGPFVEHAAEHPSPDRSSDLGYRGLLENTVGNLANFHNFQDDALEAWDLNNTLFKPNRFVTSTQSYGYTPGNVEGRRCTLVGLLTARLVLGQNESLAFVASSRTLAAGRQQTGAAIDENIDLSAPPYNFGDDHSAQWNRAIQQVSVFYNEMLRQFDITFIP